MRWLLTLTCCGRSDGYQVCRSWEEADDFRAYYLDAETHDRSAVLTECADALPFGYHDSLGGAE